MINEERVLLRDLILDDIEVGGDPDCVNTATAYLRVVHGAVSATEGEG